MERLGLLQRVMMPFSLNEEVKMADKKINKAEL